ncbi:MAG: gamma-glutamyltransferase, partial [Emcibacteraceae bacterium]|nr:gamma-glutamyltransferase [Emcibacteraceae bacterium]
MKQLFKHSFTLIVMIITFSNFAANGQQTGANPILDFATITHPVSAKNGMVASQVTLASQIGIDILKSGGNAVDSAVATGFALAVTLPRAGNIAGGGFMLIYLAEKDEYVALDYKEMAPAAASRDMYIKSDGTVDFDTVRFTRKGFGVPGTVAAMVKALNEYGTMTLQEVLAPSIDAARNGIKVTEGLAEALIFAKDKLYKDPEARKIFFNSNGEPLKSGELLVQTDLAWSLEQIATFGADAFYKGEIARRITDDMVKNGGLVTMEDMNNYVVATREPV